MEIRQNPQQEPIPRQPQEPLSRQQEPLSRQPQPLPQEPRLQAEEQSPPVGQYGYLRIRVTTAGGILPLEDARITITGGTKETSGVVHTALTDRDGLTDPYPLPTKPLSDSLVPGATQPYTTYNLDVDKDGYFSQVNIGIPIFPGITSIQPVDLIPMPTEENLYPEGDTRYFEGEQYFPPEEPS